MPLFKKKHRLHPEQETRSISINCPAKLPPRRYPSNKSVTSKYTLLSFIPLNLFEQFHRLRYIVFQQKVANVFFLFTATLQQFPIFTIGFTSWYAFMPLVFIIGLTAAKDGYEDYIRHVSDKTINETHVWVLKDYNNPQFPNSHPQFPDLGVSTHSDLKGVNRQYPNPGLMNTSEIRNSTTGISAFQLKKLQTKEIAELKPAQTPVFMPTEGWVRTMRQYVRMGDIVLLVNNECVPADMIILSTGLEDGIAFVSTKSLDGESNLKQKDALSLTQDSSSPLACSNNSISFEFEMPNARLYAFNGNYQKTSVGNTKEANHAVTINNVLLSGGFLRNTSWVVGCIVGTGSESKIMLNSSKPSKKRSQIEQNLNYMVPTLINLGLL